MAPYGTAGERYFLTKKLCKPHAVTARACFMPLPKSARIMTTKTEEKARFDSLQGNDGWRSILLIVELITVQKDTGR